MSCIIYVCVCVCVFVSVLMKFDEVNLYSSRQPAVTLANDSDHVSCNKDSKANVRYNGYIPPSFCRRQSW